MTWCYGWLEEDNLVHYNYLDATSITSALNKAKKIIKEYYGNSAKLVYINLYN